MKNRTENDLHKSLDLSFTWETALGQVVLRWQPGAPACSSLNSCNYPWEPRASCLQGCSSPKASEGKGLFFPLFILIKKKKNQWSPCLSGLYCIRGHQQHIHCLHRGSWLLIPTLPCAQWEQLFFYWGRLILSSLARTPSCPVFSTKRKAQRSGTCDLSFHVLEPHSTTLNYTREAFLRGSLSNNHLSDPNWCAVSRSSSSNIWITFCITYQKSRP